MTMTTDEAQEALSLIRRVVNKVHDDTIAQNWGAVMIVTAILDLIAFGTTEVLIDRGVRTIAPFAVTWVVYTALALAANLAVRQKMGGTMTYVERHIWANGLTFYSAAFALVGIDLYALDVERAIELIPAHISVVGAVSFAFMALIDARFFIYTIVFFATAALLGVWTEHGFAVQGVVWFFCLGIPGVQYWRARRRATVETR